MTADLVIPTVGRSTLRRLLDALLTRPSTVVDRIIVVDDRPSGPALEVPEGVSVVRSRGRGPAAARNHGWRVSDAEWIVFLDDDVVPSPEWAHALAGDLMRAGARTAAVQGRIRVPLASGRRPTDWEREVAGLESARYATADMAYRRCVLQAIGGFDERFPRAYREDADLALRTLAAGHEIALGERVVLHPVGEAPWWISLARQRGNADDALMRVLHGPGWRERAEAPRGRLPRHAAIVAAAAAALAAAIAGRRRPAGLAAAACALGTAELAARRILPGPRTPEEIAAMAVTSIAIPPLAAAYRAAGELRARRLAARPRAVLFDRDGTLIEDVAYNGDPARVVARPGARAALETLRRAGIRTAVVTNQSGVGRGLLSEAAMLAVNRRVEELLGPLGPWLSCLHSPDEGCACRKPAPGLIRDAATALGVRPQDCVVIGDIGADVEAARAAGARAILVPTPATRREEVEAAPHVAPTLPAAVDLVLAESAR